MSEKISGKAFDIKIFLRLMSYAKRYKLRFFIAAISTITLAFVSAVNPYIVGETVNDFVNNQDVEKLIYYIQILLTIQSFGRVRKGPLPESGRACRAQ